MISDTIVTPIASASTICAATGVFWSIATTSVSASVVMFAPMMYGSASSRFT